MVAFGKQRRPFGPGDGTPIVRTKPAAPSVYIRGGTLLADYTPTADDELVPMKNGFIEVRTKTRPKATR